MIRKLVRNLAKSLLQMTAQRAGAGDGAALETRVTALGDRDFEARARQALAERQRSSSTVLAGTVQLVGLDAIRKELGEGWSQIAGKAHAIAERVIASQLGARDLFSAHGNDSYVLCFPTLNVGEAKRKTSAIVAEIKAGLEQAIDRAERVGVSEFVAEVEFAPALEADRRLIDVLAESLHAIRKEAAEAYQRHRAALLRDAEIFFRPVWQVSQKSVGLYRSVLDERTGRSSLDYLRSLSTPEEIQNAMAELDYLIFSQSIKALHRLLQSNIKARFLVPVHFNTVNLKPLREEYLRLCHTVPESYRSFCVLEIYGVPNGTPSSRLRELVPPLRSACDAIVFELPMTERTVEDFRAAGLLGFSADIRMFNDHSTSLVQRFSRATRAATDAGLQTIAHGADTLGLVHEAMRAGFAHVSGQGVAPTTDRPRGVYSLNPAGAVSSAIGEPLRKARA